MGTKKILKQIQDLENRIITERVSQKLPPTIIQEMKKIGIERLPYSYSAVERFIDKETMNVHYNKHYKGYVEKLNRAIKNKKGKDKSLEEIIKTISRFDRGIKDNAGGAFNHALFWKMLSPKKQRCTGDIYDKIIKEFKTFNNFKKQFESVAQKRFGSGWVWLVLTKNDRLKIMSTSNQDNPLMNTIRGGGFPLLGLDLWEHSYYLKYKNKRDDYIKNFWSVVNWSFVNELLQSQTKENLNESYIPKELLIEGESTGCSSRQVRDTIDLFNRNPRVKWSYRKAIDEIFKEMFKDYWRERQGDQLSGIYDFEYEGVKEPGRSVLNKINTNATTFCILQNDMNKVLKYYGYTPPINFKNKNESQQIKEVYRFINYIRQFKDRLFGHASKTFTNMYQTVDRRNKQGDKTEQDSVKLLQNIFGYENVKQVGELGSVEDAIGGVDAVVRTKDGDKTAQIKPFKYYKESDGKITMVGTGVIKQYDTDLMIFHHNKKGVMVFDNSNTEIVNGQYVFDRSKLYDKRGNV
jgi:Fe-Mn family superoxide dismutase